MSGPAVDSKQHPPPPKKHIAGCWHHVHGCAHGVAVVMVLFVFKLAGAAAAVVVNALVVLTCSECVSAVSNACGSDGSC